MFVNSVVELGFYIKARLNLPNSVLHNLSICFQLFRKYNYTLVNFKICPNNINKYGFEHSVCVYRYAKHTPYVSICDNILYVGTRKITTYMVWCTNIAYKSTILLCYIN